MKNSARQNDQEMFLDLTITKSEREELKKERETLKTELQKIFNSNKIPAKGLLIRKYYA
ncbi:hypothetical protein N9W34_00175 [Rickettsiales bacterium]|nr:hypothetical protein [Rickettsiales bacterium]